MKNLFDALKVTSNTDYIKKGSTFVALPGFRFNGIDFIPLALEKGADTIVVQKDQVLSKDAKSLIKAYSAKVVCVDDARITLAKLSAQAYGFAGDSLRIIGVTGTKGKTTSVFLLHHIFTSLGFNCALISGVFNVINSKKYASSLTTPQADYLQAFFDQCVQKNVEYVFMEASAHAFSLHRLYGIKFCGGIFTNLDLEHLEFYKDIEDYFLAKSEMLNYMKDNTPFVVNTDNIWGKRLFESKKELLSFSLLGLDEDFILKDLKCHKDGQSFSLNIKGNSTHFASSLIGKFNAYNLGMVISLAYKLGLPLQQIAFAIKDFSCVPGRMEKIILANGALAIIDYAHNPLSYNSVLPELKKICKDLIVVFGAGGERDSSRRPLMGEAVSKWANRVIITSDNPRSESAQYIASQICSGMPARFLANVNIELDRERAINMAYKLSNKDSIIAILGKGPDNYQIIGSRKFYFSDRAVALKFTSFFQKS